MIKISNLLLSMILILHLFLIAFSNLSFGLDSKETQKLSKSNFVLSQWTMENGLPQSSVNDIIQTKDGFIWLATFGGLIRFDGVDFKTYDRSNTKGMRSDRVLSLFEDRNGAIWLGTEDGFLKFENEECQVFLIIKNNQIFSPLMVAEDNFGEMWITAHAQIYRLENESFEQIPVINDPNRIEEAYADTNGVWMANNKKLFKTIGKEVLLIEDFENKITEYIVSMIEYPSRSRILYLASSGDGVIKYEKGKVSYFSDKQGLASRYTWNLKEDLENRLWVISYDGISYLNNNRFQLFDVFEKENNTQIKTVLQDNELNYWVGTTTNGLYRLKPTLLSTIDSRKGLDDEKMLSLTQLHNGKSLFSTNCGGVFEWDGQKAIHSPINSYLPNLCVWSVFQDSKKRIWFGAKGLYMSQKLSQKGIYFNSQNGFDDGDVFAISEDSEGIIWIGSLNGVFRYDGKEFKKYTVQDGLPYNDTRVFFHDSDSSLWIGTTAGLARFSKGKIEPILLTQSTDSKNRNSEPYIRAVYKDANNVYWIGTYGNGLFRIKNGKVSNITKDNGLFDNIVSHLIMDDNGNFWIGCNRGIYSINKNILNDYFDGKINQVYCKSFGVADGMKSSETNGGFAPNAFKDTLGIIYFPTVSGVVKVDPMKIHDFKFPAVFITKLVNGSKNLAIADSISLDYTLTDLTINYSALHYSAPDKIRFKYKLEGLNDSWFEVGNQRTALYSKIPPGEYTFNVTASNSEGEWNSSYASIFIRIEPPFWDTIWFTTIAILLLLSSILSIFYLRIKKLNLDKIRQKWFTDQLIDSQESERFRIASELHDGLGQQLLVIKNRVEMAKKSIENKDELNYQLNEILYSAVSSIQDVRTISHGLRPVHLENFGLSEAINNLCEQQNESSSIDWSYHIDELAGLIPENQEIHFYRVIQEAMSNIYKHSNATEASVIIKIENDSIKVTLWDDGKGFNATKQKKSGLGFIGMQERIDSLSGTLHIQSGDGKGTSIKIAIPIT